MLTEGQGAYFEQEILDYMKFGLIDMIWDSMDENGAREMLSQFKDAEGINGCSVRYEAIPEKRSVWRQRWKDKREA